MGIVDFTLTPITSGGSFGHLPVGAITQTRNQLACCLPGYTWQVLGPCHFLHPPYFWEFLHCYPQRYFRTVAYLRPGAYNVQKLKNQYCLIIL